MLTNNILALVTTIFEELTGEYFAMTEVVISIYFEKKYERFTGAIRSADAKANVL